MADNESIYSPRVLLGAVQHMTPPRKFLKDTFVKRIITFESEAVDFDLVKGGRKMAPFVSPVHEGKIMQRDGYETKTIKPAYVKPKRTITPGRTLTRKPGEPYNSLVTPLQRATQLLGEDLAFLDDAITRREEWMIAQALFTGGIIIEGEGIKSHVDFDINTVVVPAAETWEKDTVDGGAIAKLMRSWRTEATKNGSAAPNIAIMSNDVAEVMVEKMVDYLDTRRLDLGTLDIRLLPDGVTYWGQLKGTGIDLYSYDEWFEDDVTGETKPMVPVNTMLLASTSVDAAMLYGAIQDLDALVALPRFPKSWSVEDPSRRFVMIQSAPMFSPFDTGAYQIIKPLTV